MTTDPTKSILNVSFCPGFSLPFHVIFTVVRTSSTVMSSLQYLLDREPLLAPLVEPASHAHDMGVAHLFERLSR